MKYFWRVNMHKCKCRHTPDSAKYIIAGIVIGSAVGTAISVVMKQRHPRSMLMSKASAAMDMMGTVMQNIAHFAR